MPQLDSLTFFNQLFWFVFIFILFYGLVLTVVLPTIAKILKLRYKLLDKSNLLLLKKQKKLNTPLVLFNHMTQISAFFLFGTSTKYLKYFIKSCFLFFYFGLSRFFSL